MLPGDFDAWVRLLTLLPIVACSPWSAVLPAAVTTSVPWPRPAPTRRSRRALSSTSWRGAERRASGSSPHDHVRLVTDSVGGTGGSLHVIGATSLTLDFGDYLAANGVLPNRAGIVWTDVGGQFGECWGAFSGVGEVRFEAFDGSNVSLGLISAVLGDGSFDGGTSEDRFFGASNAGGISRLAISMPTSEDWEVDHLQFCTAVPEPGTCALLIAGFGLVGVVMRRRTRGVAA